MKNKPINILLIEDNPEDVRLFKELLEDEARGSYQLSQTDRLLVGLERLAAEKFDVVFVDLGLPDSKGLNTLKAITNKAGHLPAIVITGLDDETTAIASMRLGAQDYLLKGRMGGSVLWRVLNYSIERKQLEYSLRREQMMLARTEDIANVGSWEWDVATDIVAWSDELFRIFQRNPQEGAPSFAEHPAFYHPDDMARLQQAVEAAVADGTPYELELRAIRKDGETRMCIARGVAEMGQAGRAVRLFGSLQDITERKQAEESLRKSEANYRLLADNMTDTVWLMDMNLRTTYSSPSVERMRGFTLKEIEEMPLEKHLTPESLQLATAVFLEEMDKVNADPEYDFTRTIELEFYRKDGSAFWSENTFSLIRDENGRPLSILGEGRDITKRKQAEEMLRKSDARYRLLAEHTTDVIRLLDMDLKTTYLSPSAEKLRGFTVQEMVEMPLERQLTPESLRTAYAILSEEIPRVESDPGYNPIFSLDIEYYCKDGTTLWTETKFSIVRDENGRAVSILAEARDISERKLSEEKLLKSYESLKKTLNDSINTMVKIVELRDPYTAGHQQKVADLATAIAREMELDDIQIDQLKTAAVIHDIGKMYVPSDILSKPGKISNMEFNLIKTHAQAGFDIVKGMDFPGTVAETVLQHHERLNGSGYPNGLKAEDTLMKAKILAVADVIEAMSSHRPYRPALGIDRALEEISKYRGKLYDPDVVDACLELFKSGKFEFKSV
jgi:PAS domain S-box-containing protein/putative nucleotidyltransferase with HDIG domain